MLYADYIKEREGYECITTSDGFMSYTFIEDSCYIRDLYITPRKRREYAAKEMFHELETIAKSTGSKRILTTVKPSANGSTVSLKAILSVGFELLSSERDAILFKKEIR